MIVEVKQDKNIIFLVLFQFSLVFPLDLFLMSYYRHHDQVNTSAVATTGYDGNDKWMELHSARAQYHLWRVRHRALF